MLDYKQLSPVLIFIFGGSGDLNYRKLTPALFNLYIDKALPEKFSFVGIARSEYKDGEYENRLKEGIQNFSRRKDSNNEWCEFSKHMSYLQFDITQSGEYSKISKIAKDTEAQFGVHPSIIFYMAVAPQ